VSRKEHISETPATAFLRANKVAFTEHPYCQPEVANRHSGYPQVCVQLLHAAPVNCALAE
jgi:hypothetical protein